MNFVLGVVIALSSGQIYERQREALKNPDARVAFRIRLQAAPDAALVGQATEFPAKLDPYGLYDYLVTKEAIQSLQLTDEQVAKLKAGDKATRVKRAAAMRFYIDNRVGQQRQQVANMIHAVFEEERAGVDQILTPKQLEKLRRRILQNEIARRGYDVILEDPFASELKLTAEQIEAVRAKIAAGRPELMKKLKAATKQHYVEIIEKTLKPEEQKQVKPLLRPLDDD